MSTFLTVLLTIISIIAAILLIGIILIQQSKTTGGLGAVSGGAVESMFGASASNVLTKGTTWIAVVFLVSTLLLAAVTGRMSSKSVLEGKSNVGQIAEQKAAEQKEAEAKKAAEDKKAADLKKAEESKKAAETKKAEAPKKAEEGKTAEADKKAN